MDERVQAIDSALEVHWRLFGTYPGASLHEEHGLLWFESPIATLPYNGIIGTRLAGPIKIEAVAHAMIDHFARRHVPFFWLGRPSDSAPGFAGAMTEAGLRFTETITGMDLDLADWAAPQPPSAAEIVEVDSEGILSDGLRDYERLTSGYWGIEDDQRPLATALTRYYLGARNPGYRLVAYLDGRPVGKVFVQLLGMPQWTMIAGLAVIPGARGQGVARLLVQEALRRSQEAGAGRVVLHSTRMAMPLFDGLGFTARCEFGLHTTAEMFH
jgi:ribosomal protein S18 acetylase RimI-like enzyme